MLNHYQLEGDPTKPRLGNLIYDELGQEAIARLNEEFQGNASIAYQTLPQIGQQVAYSNLPRNLFFNQFVRKTCNDIHVSSPEEVIRFWDSIPKRDTTYADTNSVAVYPNQGPNEDLRQRALYLIGKTKTKVPLIVSGLGVDRGNNGFKFTETPYVEAKEALWLEKDQRVRYDPKKGIVPCEENEPGVSVWTPGSQSGLWGLYRCRSDLDAGYGDLLDSNGDGRVPLVQDPQGRAENFTDTNLLEHKISTALKEKKAFEYQGLIYIPVAASALKPVD